MASNGWVEARKTVCIDFNGVLDTYTGYENGKSYPPRPGVKEFLQKLADAGWKVIIMTAVPVQIVYEWLFEYDLLDETIIFDVVNEKVPALIYLDDRGITFNGDFNKAFFDIQHFKTHWEDADHHEGGCLE